MSLSLCTKGSRSNREFVEFILLFGKKDAIDIRVEDVSAWNEHLGKRELAPHTIATKPATLSALFEYFRDYGIINRNPATTKLVLRPAKPLQSPKGKALTVKEVRYLLYTIHRDNPIDLRDFAIVYSILRLSLRVSEICHNMSKHKSVKTLMIYNKGLDNLENNAVHDIKYDSE